MYQEAQLQIEGLFGKDHEDSILALLNLEEVLEQLNKHQEFEMAWRDARHSASISPGAVI